MTNTAKSLICLAALGAFFCSGCGEEGRKEASKEEICKAYQDQLKGILGDSKMSNQDKRNLITRLGSYTICGSEADLPPADGAGAPTGTPSPSDLINRDSQRRGGG